MCVPYLFIFFWYDNILLFAKVYLLDFNEIPKPRSLAKPLEKNNEGEVLATSQPYITC
jgi:hypothetical protein